jgi:hypothetical protein
MTFIAAVASCFVKAGRKLQLLRRLATCIVVAFVAVKRTSSEMVAHSESTYCDCRLSLGTWQASLHFHCSDYQNCQQ